MTIKAIETVYKNHTFRSRLEARWAVFFDALGAKWAYEFEGFDLGNGDWYIPDFHFPILGIWVEIKPKIGWSQDAIEKAKSFGAIITYGSPDDYRSYDWKNTYGGTVCADLGRWGMTWDELGFGFRCDGEFNGYRTPICHGCEDFDIDSVAIKQAIAAAMATRFEYGKP